MSAFQTTRLFSGDITERETFSTDLAVVCLWSFTGVLLTVLDLPLCFGGEIWQALALAG
jgi:hypothetical protein